MCTFKQKLNKKEEKSPGKASHVDEVSIGLAFQRKFQIGAKIEAVCRCLEVE
jgi:hypothetical protein